MVITDQGVAIQPCFQQSKHMQFCKTGQQVVFIKLGQNMHQRMGLNLPSQSLPGSPDRGTVLRVWGRGTSPRSLARSTAHRQVLPRSYRDLRRTQTSTQSRKRNKGFIAKLDSETIKI